jgi:cysteine-rich repeat protein
MHDQLVVEADAAQDIPVGPIGPTEGDPFDAAATAPDLPPDLVSAPDIVDVASDTGPDTQPDSSSDLPPDLSPDLSADVTPSVCGDGVVGEGELCDDGNLIDDDACSNDCTTPSCGDGITQAGEQCDDGNETSEDRCTPTCKWVPFKQIAGDGVSPGLCGLRTNGNVTCWGGSNPPPAIRFASISDGQCGIKLDGTIACWGSVTNPPAGQFTKVDVGVNFACAIRTDGTVTCWGDPSSNALVTPTGTFKAVSAGQVACAVQTDGKLLCWGVWGLGNFANVGLPAGTFVDVSVGTAGACATDTQGALKCWGAVAQPAPGVHAVVVSNFFACALQADSNPICWYESVDGNGPDGPPPDVYGKFTQVATNGDIACGLHPDGTIGCWGPSLPSPTAPPMRLIEVGINDNNAFFGRDSPVQYQEVDLGNAFGCGLRLDGHIECWDNNGPFGAQPPGVFRHVASGGRYACAIDLQGQIVCWGDNSGGQTTPPSGTFLRISASYSHTCALRADGAVSCWGTPVDGGTLTPPPPGPFLEVAAGPNGDCALDASQNIQCWGSGPFVTAPKPTGLHQIALGETVGCGLKASGELACFGDVASWTYIPPGPFRAVSVGISACALRRNGEVVCFGASPGPVLMNGDAFH